MSAFANFGNTQTNPTTGGGLFGGNNQQQQQQPSGGGLFGNLPAPQTQNTTQQPSSLFGNTSTTPAQQPTQVLSPLFGGSTTLGSGLFGAQNTNTNTNTNTGSGGGLFGGQQQQQQTGGGGLFGNTSNQQQQPAGGGGLFGSTSNQQQPAQGGGLFGNTSNQPATGGGLFGNTSNQQQQPAAGGGLFGNMSNQQQPAAGGGLFGNASNQQQQPASGGLFGNTSNQQQQQPSAGGGLFGNTSNQQQQPSTGGGLFGNTQQQQQQPNATGGGLFGSTQTGGGGLFGSKPGGLFGSTLGASGTGTSNNANTGNASTTPNSLFGNTQTQQQQQQQGGSLFGQSQQQQPQRSLFGNQPTSNNSLFGAGGNNSTLNASALGGGLGQQPGGFGGSILNSNSLLSSRPSAPAQQQGIDPQAQSQKLTQRIEEIYGAWNSSSPQCRFKHVFYNLVDPNQVNLYGRPPNATDDALWAKALRENPDPSCLVPVVAIGFDDLRERVNAQSSKAAEHQAALKELKTRLEALNERHALSNASRLQRASAHQTQLTQRLLAFIQHLHLLIPALRSSSIRPEEEQLRGKLEEIEEEVRRGRLKGKLNELWALVGAVNAAKERGGGAGGGGGNGGGAGEWAVVDEDGLAQIAQILSDQQAGLAHLTKILQRDLKDLDVIMGKGSGGSSEESYEGDNLWTSTSTLRASSLR